MTSNSLYDLECLEVSKTFETFKAVDQISFEIATGSFFSILGPSGCGKTTLLRMIAGFQHPDQGDILIKGKSVIGTPPNRRPVNMVFQHLALFPTMNVADNIAYGLKRHKVHRDEIKKRVNDVLTRVDLPDAGEKQISQLSGGQKQRIAIARCLVLKPDVLLLDEPLGALDLKLREQMKVELKLLQETFGTTFIYITHDQSEALVMSDQVAVMNQGRFEQVGTPQELYFNPKTPFVASFVGDNNRWDAKVETIEGEEIQVKTDQGEVFAGRSEQMLKKGDSVVLYVRPEAISIANSDQTTEKTNQCQGEVKSVLFDGARTQFLVKLLKSEKEISVAMPQTGEYAQLQKGDGITMSWAMEQCVCFRHLTEEVYG